MGYLEALFIDEEKICDVCDGLGAIDWGDPENGVMVECPRCLGIGRIEI